MRLNRWIAVLRLSYMPRFTFALLLVLPLITAALHAGEDVKFDWPQWLGPLRQPLSDESKWQKVWPANGPKQLWRAKVGKGYAAVSVSNGRVFTAGNDGVND